MAANASEDDENRLAGLPPISRVVAENLVRLRGARGLSTTALSALVKELGQPIPATGITRVEKGERRVNVDELVALAVALRVSPGALLLPLTTEGQASLTDRLSVPARVAWRWLMNLRPLDLPEGKESRRAAIDDHQIHSLPPALRSWRALLLDQEAEDEQTREEVDALREELHMEYLEDQAEDANYESWDEERRG